jgi:hypothetical protein
MKRMVVVLGLVFVCGCGGLRFGPGEVQRRNAWVHNRTAALASELAEDEYASDELQALTRLGELQSRAFVAYCGLPEEFPKAETVDDVLSEPNTELAAAAIGEASERPDGWDTANAVIDLGICICAILGGVAGTRAVSFLRDARAKSNALREVVLGNELFKKTNRDNAEAFKQAHKNQSALTRELVAGMKG